MSASEASKMDPRSELKNEAVEVANLLVETFDLYEGLKRDYYPRVMQLRLRLKTQPQLKDEIGMIEEYLKLDYMNMAAAFDLSFESLLSTLDSLGGSSWDPLTIPGIPFDSDLSIIKLPGTLAFSVGVALPRPTYSFSGVQQLIGELLISRSLQRNILGGLLKDGFTKTSNFQRTQKEKITTELGKMGGIYLRSAELETVLTSIERGESSILNALFSLAEVYRKLKEDAAGVRKILLRSIHLKEMGEDFFKRHNIVLVERSF